MPILKLPVCMTVFCSYGMEKILGLRSEFGRQLKKNKKPSGSSGGSVREWKFLKSLSFLWSVIVPRKSVDNLAKPEETQVLRPYGLSAQPSRSTMCHLYWNEWMIFSRSVRSKLGLLSPLFVCLSVRPSVCRLWRACTVIKRLTLLINSLPYCSPRTWLYSCQKSWKIPTASPPTEALNTDGVWKIAIFDHYLAMSQKRYKIRI